MTGFLVAGKTKRKKGKGSILVLPYVFSDCVFQTASVRTSESDGSVGFFLSFFFVSSREDYEE